MRPNAGSRYASRSNIVVINETLISSPCFVFLIGDTQPYPLKGRWVEVRSSSEGSNHHALYSRPGTGGQLTYVGEIELSQAQVIKDVANTAE